MYGPGITKERALHPAVRQVPGLIVGCGSAVGRLRTNQFEGTTVYQERTDLIPRYNSLSFVSIDSHSLTRCSPCEASRVVKRDWPGQQHPDYEHEVLLS